MRPLNHTRGSPRAGLSPTEFCEYSCRAVSAVSGHMCQKGQDAVGVNTQKLGQVFVWPVSGAK